MFESIKTYLIEELDVLMGAPVTFSIALMLVCGLCWFALRWRYEGVNASLRERIENRDEKLADYKSKLDGASPDEAKKRIDFLEEKLKSLEPRRVGREFAPQMVDILSTHAGAIDVTQDMMGSDNRGLSVGIGEVFRSAGWTVQMPMVGGPSNPPIEGIAVTVLNLSSLSARDKAVFAAMDKLGYPYARRGGLRQNPNHPVDVEILITTPA